MALMTAARARAAPADPAFGDWFTGDRDARVRIGPCADRPAEACGVIVWLKSPNGSDGQPLRDTANPNHGLRDRTLVGISLLDGFKREAPGRWSDGRIYDPQNGMNFRSKMSAQPNG